jgi:hypothetical protein
LYGGYPQLVRAWIARHGGLKSEMIYLQGRELRSLVGGCTAGRTARAAGRPPSRRSAANEEAEILTLANRLGL